jgi:hypothetical protein
VLNPTSPASRWLLVMGLCLAFSPSLRADGIYVWLADTYVEAVRPLDLPERVDFFVLLTISNDPFVTFENTQLYNSHGDMINLFGPDWSSFPYPEGSVVVEVHYSALIDKDTPLGLYNSSSPTSYQPANFTVYASNPYSTSGSETSVSIPMSLDVQPNPLAVPEPCSAVLLCLGALAPLGRSTLRRVGRQSSTH